MESEKLRFETARLVGRGRRKQLAIETPLVSNTQRGSHVGTCQPERADRMIERCHRS